MNEPIQKQEAEMSVLGSLLLDNQSIFKVIDILTEQDFYHAKNRITYSAIIDLFKLGVPIDLLTVGNYLENKKLIEQVPHSYIVGLTNAVATASHIENYALIVKDQSIRRQLLEAQEKNTRTIYDTEKDIDSVLVETQKRIIDINNFRKLDDGAKSIIRELEDVQKVYEEKYAKGDKFVGIPCGIEKLDEIIDGLRPGHIWVVGAFTSTGKTQFALNLVNSVLEQGVPTSIISLEMSRVDLAARLIGIRQNVSSMKILKGKIDFELWKQIESHKDFISKAPLEIHTTYFDLEKIKMLIRKDVYSRQVKFVVVDYVQNILSEKGLREYDLMTQAAIDLQALARELQITIYLVSQISNEAEKGQGAGAGFKGTGALEAVADLAIRLKRDKKNEKEEDACVPIEIIVTKNRHGFTGKISEYFMYLKSGKFSINPSLK